MRYIWKRCFAALLSVALLLALLPATALAEDFPESLSGEGNENSPYQISTAEQLAQLSQYVNSGEDCSGKYFKLMNNIDLGGGPDNQWTPIGDDSNPFKGTFDGDGHTVSGLYIKSEGKDLGLFGVIGKDGTVKNLGVSGSVTGEEKTRENYVGGIAGINNGTIENCYHAADITGYAYVGGIAGNLGNSDAAHIQNCYNTGTIQGYNRAVIGGIAGRLGIAFVENSYNAGDISGDFKTGGLLGLFGSEGWFSNCYNIGNVIGTDEDFTGGLAGDSGIFKSCFYLKGTAPRDFGPGGSSGGDAEKTADDFRNLASELNKDGNDAWIDDPFLGRPVLKSNQEPSSVKGDGSAENPFEITTREKLEQFREYVNSGHDCSGMYFKLADDINLGGSATSWTPIGNGVGTEFRGTFDGNNHTISGLYINQPDESGLGLFGTIGMNGTVKNLSVSGSVAGGTTVGGIAGINSGTIENCYNKADITCTGTVNAAGINAGGVAGASQGTIKGCRNSGIINGITSVGGIVGNAVYGSVQNCYNTGRVTGTVYNTGGVAGTSGGTVENCYNVGAVSGTSGTGGVVGKNNSGTVNNCYYLDTCGAEGEGTKATADQFRFLASALGEGWADSDAGRPVLLDNQEADVNIIGADTPYEISDKEELEAFRDYINNDPKADGGKDKTFKLTDDIDLQGGADNPWTPIGTNNLQFQGTFDGNDHTISGLNITTGNDQGLFGVIGNSGTVKNLTVKGSVTGAEDVGGIAGHSFGNIENCHNAANIKGSSYTGGIVGHMDGGASMQNCSNIGTVNGGSNTGGLAGYGWTNGTIENCYNTGNVTGGSSNVGGITGYLKSGGTVKNCYNVGEIKGGKTGGVVGNNEGTVQSCYNYGIVNGSGGPVRGNDRGQCINCFYLDTWVKDGRGAVAKSAEQFASGEVAWLLQKEQGAQVWGQTVNSGIPELTDSPDKKVYQITGKVEEQADIVWYSNNKATLPDAPAKEGLAFAGWSTQSGGSVNFTANTTVEKDMTVYAVFKEITSGGGISTFPVDLPTETGDGTITSNPASAIPGSRVTLTVKPDEGHHLGSLTVTDRNGKPVEVTDNGDGTYTFTMPYGQATVKAEFTKCGSLDFTDLDVGAWYHDYTDYVINHGLMRGVGGGLFDPNGAVTRAQMVTVLWNMRGKPVVNYYMTYSDVTEDAWYAEAVRWAASEGIAKGYGNGKFGPGDPISREQMAVMLYRYEQKYGDAGFTGEWMYRLPFTDLDRISDWAFEAVAWCNMRGVITGKGNGVFDPKGPAKRGEMAAILTRYCDGETGEE